MRSRSRWNGVRTLELLLPAMLPALRLKARSPSEDRLVSSLRIRCSNAAYVRPGAFHAGSVDARRWGIAAAANSPAKASPAAGEAAGGERRPADCRAVN